MVDSQSDQTIAKTEVQHGLFIHDEESIFPNFFGFHYVQVDATEKCLIYRDGLLYNKPLEPGPHRWWNGFMHKWKKQRINTRFEIIPFTVKGRVRGPSMPTDVPGAQAADLACDVTARLDLSCQLVNVEAHLRYSQPLSIFYATIEDIVVELIGKLPYDKYGEWITRLRDDIMFQLTSPGARGNVEQSIGIKVEKVLVKNFQPNTAHDRNMIANYQLVERIRREAAEAQAKAEHDAVAAESYRKQGELLNIAPAILALKETPIGVALIENDANLRKLSIAAGLNPGVNVQPIQEPGNQLGLGGAATGYLNLPSPRGPSGQGAPPSTVQQASGPLFAPPSQQTGPVYPGYQAQPFQPTGPIYPGYQAQPLQPTGPISSGFPTQPSAPLNLAGNPIPVPDAEGGAAMSQEGSPVDPSRLARELAALREHGFETAGEGKVTPVYDQTGNSATKEWVLQVAAPRPGGYLVMVFHCPSGYPAVAPSVQLRNPAGGLRWIEPNTIQDWNLGRMLFEVAQEINNDIP